LNVTEYFAHSLACKAGGIIPLDLDVLWSIPSSFNTYVL